MSKQYKRPRRGTFFDTLTGAVGGAASAGMRAYSNSANKRRAVSAATMPSGVSFVSRRRRRMGRTRKRGASRVFKNLIGQGRELIMRYQNSSQTYIGPGSIKIGWGGAASSAVEHNLPMHFMSLTSLGYLEGTNASLGISKGCRQNGMFRVNYDPTVGSELYKYYPIPCQNFAGVSQPLGIWQLEKFDGDLTTLGEYTKISNVFHKYSDIKLNLYGVYDVPIRYHVQLVMFDPTYDPLYTSGAVTPLYNSVNTDVGEMWQDMVKPLLYNSVNTNTNKDWRRYTRVLKSHDVTVQPISYSDQRAERQDAAEGQTVGHTGGHIHELRWFVRHDRFRKYDWDHPPTQPGVNGNVGTWDLNLGTGIYCDVKAGARLFMLVTASAAQFDATGTSPNITGSYDICVRNSFVLFQ